MSSQNALRIFDQHCLNTSYSVIGIFNNRLSTPNITWQIDGTKLTEPKMWDRNQNM
jgi:hypothetical protein